MKKLNFSFWLPVFAFIAFACCLALLTPVTAYAAEWTPINAVERLLAFVRLVIVLAAASICVQMILKHQVVAAIVAILLAGLVYVSLDPDTVQAIGSGIKNLIGLGGGTGNTP